MKAGISGVELQWVPEADGKQAHMFALSDQALLIRREQPLKSGDCSTSWQNLYHAMDTSIRNSGQLIGGGPLAKPGQMQLQDCGLFSNYPLVAV